jgi:hypothetical protein
MATRKNNKRLAEIEAELADSEDEKNEVKEKHVVATRGRSAATSRKAAKTKGDVVTLDDEEEPIHASRGRVAAVTRKAINKKGGRSIKVEDLFDSEAEEAEAEAEEEEEGEGEGEHEQEEEGEDDAEEPVVTTRGRGFASLKASNKRVVSASKGIADDEEDEQIARGQSLGIISPDMATAVAIANTLDEEKNALLLPGKRTGSSSSSLASTPGSSSNVSVTDLGSSSRKSMLWSKKKSPAGEGGGSASKLAPNSNGTRRRITRMHTTVVRDRDTHAIMAVFVSNAYDRAQFLNGTLDYQGGNEKGRMVKYPMRLFYTNVRNQR